MMNFDPAKLKYYRTHKVGLSMQELAEKSGLSYRTVFNAENGVHPPVISTVRKLAQALEVAIEDLLKKEPSQMTNTETSEKTS